MATINATINNIGWQDVETIANTTFTNGNTYVISILGGNISEVCIASTTPAEGLLGHPLKGNENLAFTYTTGNKIYIKTDCIGRTLVIT